MAAAHPSETVGPAILAQALVPIGGKVTLDGGEIGAKKSSILGI